MKRLMMAIALTAFGFAPAVAFACSYQDSSASADDTSASATAPEQLALATAPAASHMPTSMRAKTVTSKAMKKVSSKAGPSAAARANKPATTTD